MTTVIIVVCSLMTMQILEFGYKQCNKLAFLHVKSLLSCFLLIRLHKFISYNMKAELEIQAQTFEFGVQW